MDAGRVVLFALLIAFFIVFIVYPILLIRSVFFKKSKKRTQREWGDMEFDDWEDDGGDCGGDGGGDGGGD